MTAALSERLRAAAAGLPTDGVSLQQLASLHGPAGLGTLLILLATPCVLPVPGVGSILGLGLLALSLSLWRGEQSEQSEQGALGAPSAQSAMSGMPQRVADLKLPSAWAARVLKLLAGFYARAAQASRPRLSRLTEPSAHRWLAIKTALMAVLIVLPIPFGNLLPALALMLLGLGLVARDGVAVILATLMAAGAVLFSVAIFAGAWLWGFELVELIQHQLWT